MDGRDAPESLSPTAISRPEEGLQHHSEVEYSIEYAETPLAPSPYPQRNDLRPESIAWSTHPRNQESHRAGLVQSSSSRQESLPWDASSGSLNARTVSSSVNRRGTTTTLSFLSENTSPRDVISSDAVRHAELGSQATHGSSSDIEPKNVSNEPRCARSPYLPWASPRRKYWCYAFPFLTLLLLAVVIGIIVLYSKVKKTVGKALELSSTITQQTAALPMIDSALTATTVVLGSFFTSPSSSGPPDTKLVYTTSSGAICIRTKTGGSWLSNIQCITNLSPKPHTPLTILDWLGGPSIYFINSANQLCGVDNIPSNNTWKLSSVAAEKIVVHPESQLSAVTWLNGTSSWLYYQDATSQLREYGIDDYRDTVWRDGATGPLGLAIDGSGIGTARYLLDGGEVLEVFIQTINNAIHGRVYSLGVWEPDFYSVDGTTTDLSANAALTAAAVPIPPSQSTTTLNTTSSNATTYNVLLAWVSSTGFLNIQTRGTMNVTQYNTFSDPKRLIEGDGGQQPGLAVTGDGPNIYFADGQKILLLLGDGSTVVNDTSVDVTSL